MMGNGPETKEWRRDRVLLSIMLVTALLGLIYNFVVLLGYGPDELRHMRYVELLLNERRLPSIQPDGSEYAGAHTLHPPLYYLALLPFYAVFRGLPGDWEWHVVRLVSLALCVGALPLVYQIAARAGSGDRNLARLAVAQVGLLPIFGMTAGTINNDSATLFAVTLFLWLLAVRYAADRSVKSAVVLGLCFGLGGLCKATALLCNGAALVLYLLAQDGAQALRSTHAWKRLAIVLLLVAIIAGPWYLRNFSLYGQFTPIARGYTHPGLPRPEQGALVMMLHDNFPLLFGWANQSIFSTLWSQKDWIPEAVRGAIYGLLGAYCALALGGTVLSRRRHRATDAGGAIAAGAIHERVACWAAYGAFGINWLACLVIALFVHWGWAEGGRYLLPALCGLSLFLARGWRGAIGSARLPTLTVAWSLGLVALNGVTIYWLLKFLNPTYGPKG